MKNLILAAFAALTLISSLVPVAFAGPYDNTGNAPSWQCGLCGGGG